MFNAYLLLRPAVLELTDSMPGTGLGEDVRHVAHSVPGVLSVEKCFVRKMGFDYYVDLHAVVDRNMPVWQGHEIAHLVKDAIRTAHPEVVDVLVHIEPADGHFRLHLEGAAAAAIETARKIILANGVAGNGGPYANTISTNTPRCKNGTLNHQYFLAIKCRPHEASPGGRTKAIPVISGPFTR